MLTDLDFRTFKTDGPIPVLSKRDPDGVHVALGMGVVHSNPIDFESGKFLRDSQNILGCCFIFATLFRIPCLELIHQLHGSDVTVPILVNLFEYLRGFVSLKKNNKS